jgi:hypothetical protein
MHANDKALGRNWYTADIASLIRGPDWARWELHWHDGAMVSCCEETAQEALDELRRYGFYPIE